MNEITFEVYWHGERDAGINPGSETVTIKFSHGPLGLDDDIEFFRECLKDYFDGATVVTPAEAKKVFAERTVCKCRSCKKFAKRATAWCRNCGENCTGTLTEKQLSRRKARR